MTSAPSPALQRDAPAKIEQISRILVEWSGRKDLEDRLREAFKDNWRVLEHRPERLLANAKATSSAIGVMPAEFMTACCIQPDILYRSPSVLAARRMANAKLLGLSRRQLTKAARTMPLLMGVSPDTLAAKLGDTARRLGISKADVRRLFAGALQLVTLSTDKIEAHARVTAQILGLPLTDFMKVARRRPALLMRSPKATARFVEEAAEQFALPRGRITALIVRCPALAGQQAKTLYGNAKSLAENLGVETADIANAASLLPQILYMRPVLISGRIDEIAGRLHVPRDVVTSAFLRFPGIGARDPKGTARRVLIGLRMARVLEPGATCESLLLRHPAIAGYAIDRLLLRLLVARLGLWRTGLGRLIAAPNAAIERLLTEHQHGLDQVTHPARRLAALLERRLPSQP